MAAKKKSAAKAKPKARAEAKAKADPLHEQVLADPTDAGLRQVWADALIERGDPLGELIALQVAANGKPFTPAQDKRVRSLIAKHRVAWLGDLGSIAQHREGLVFDRGVLAECQIQVKKLDALIRAIGNPLWAGLRQIWFCDKFAWDTRVVELLAHPIMSQLRTVMCIGENYVFSKLANYERQLPFTDIWTDDDEWRWKTDSSVPRARPIAGIGDAPSLPALKRLGFTMRDGGERIVHLPVLKRIETLGITHHRGADLWLERTRDLRNLRTLELRPHWIPIQGAQRSHFIFRFTRDDGARGSWTRLAIEPSDPRLHVKHLGYSLKLIPKKGIDHITVPNEAFKKELKAFKHSEIEVLTSSDVR